MEKLRIHIVIIYVPMYVHIYLRMQLDFVMFVTSPVAVSLVVTIDIVISDDDGLVRNTEISTEP